MNGAEVGRRFGEAFAGGLFRERWTWAILGLALLAGLSPLRVLLRRRRPRVGRRRL